MSYKNQNGGSVRFSAVHLTVCVWREYECVITFLSFSIKGEKIKKKGKDLQSGREKENKFYIDISFIDRELRCYAKRKKGTSSERKGKYVGREG